MFAHAHLLTPDSNFANSGRDAGDVRLPQGGSAPGGSQ
jgi:hypothetical protein